MNISCSATYFLKTGARFSLKVTTKASFRSKKSGKCYAEVSAHVPQKVATKSSFRGKNTQKN